MTENQFRDFFEHGIVEHVRLVHVPNIGTAIEYMLAGGEVGMIDTKRGGVKGYRTDTALQFLKSVGVRQVVADLTRWQELRQNELELFPPKQAGR